MINLPFMSARLLVMPSMILCKMQVGDQRTVLREDGFQ
jgi:hypothetical protein